MMGDDATLPVEVKEELFGFNPFTSLSTYGGQLKRVIDDVASCLEERRRVVLGY